jgi:hypothetical protein
VSSRAHGACEDRCRGDGAGGGGQLGGDAEQPQPQPFGFPAPGLGSAEREHLHPGGQLAGQRDDGAASQRPDVSSIRADLPQQTCLTERRSRERNLSSMLPIRWVTARLKLRTWSIIARSIL